MKDKCVFCGKKRDGHWALLFSPPILDGKHRSGCWKFHVCPKCFDKMTGNFKKTTNKGEIKCNQKQSI